jgi:signal transduction histidine kinase
MKSLRTRLFGVWILSLAASIAVGVLLVQLYQQSNAALVGRAEAELSRGCDLIADRYAYYIAGWNGPVPAAGDAELQNDLDAVARVALADSPRLRGGILRDPVTTAKAPGIAALAATALADDDLVSQSSTVNGRTELAASCPLAGPVPNLAAWVATWVEAAPGYTSLTRGLAVLGVLVLGISGALTWLVTAWTRHIRRIETALAQQDAQGGLQPIAATGEAELDRIIAALNETGLRLRAAQDAAQDSAARAAAAERMAALGRVAAGVAHEIRNPIAAMRLRAEGAIARGPADPARTGAALGAILGQIDRLDRLSTELLAITQRSTPAMAPVDLPSFLQACADDHAQDGITLRIDAPAGIGRFDPAMIRRAVDNLLQNALRHTPAGGTVTLAARVTPGWLEMEVADTGPGVPPEMRDALFEPFVTGRADGTGLGLAIAREMVQAHGGTLALARTTEGARFTIALPQTTP